MKKKGVILLESGTNEIEVMKFTGHWGSSTASMWRRCREIIMSGKVKPMPHANPAVEGIFKPREALVTVINLAYYLIRRPARRTAPGMSSSSRTSTK